MQDSILWGVISVIILILLVVAVLVRKKYPRPIDYYSFFLIGIFWTVIGIFFVYLDKNYLLFASGILLVALGLVNKTKWKKNRTRWKSLKKPEKIIQGVIVALLAFVIAAGIAFLFVKAKGL